jgi:hypothetical protein
MGEIIAQWERNLLPLEAASKHIMHNHLFSSSNSALTCHAKDAWRSLCRQRKLRFLVTVTGFFAILSPLLRAAEFQEVTTDVGLVNELKKSWGDPVWGDMNNDGWLDIIVPTHGLSVSHGPMVYLSTGGTSFTDVRTTCQIIKGPELDSKDWHGFSFGDYDGDGNIDLYISEGSKMGIEPKRDLLYKGRGNGIFDYVSDVAGMITSVDRGRCGFWVDYDNDGKLDLFVKNYGSSNRLYHNNGDGTFTERAAAAGLADATLGQNFGTVCSFIDYDGDGFMDVFFSGDKTTDVLYHNNRNGTFSDVSAAAGMKPLTNGHGIAWGDYNNDGFLDLYVARGHQGSDGQTADTLYRNNGNGTFTDATAAAGLTETANTWAAIWGDYDNDGFLDLFVTNAGTLAEGNGNANFLYHNNGNGTFTNKAATEGVELQDNVTLHKGAAWGDYDNDGFLDILLKDGLGNERDHGAGANGLHRLFKNLGNGNHFIKVNLYGLQSNIKGIGARLRATYGGNTSYRQNNGGGGGEYASQGSEPVHFGIGAAATADITVTWPSGIVDTVSSVGANSTILVVEGGGPTPTPTPTPTPSPTPTPTPAPPVITKQPANKTVVEGDKARFSVGATGDPPLNYQWSKNDAEINGATDSLYLTPPTTLADDGSVFSVVISNGGGSVKSRDARLAVTPRATGLTGPPK